MHKTCKVSKRERQGKKETDTKTDTETRKTGENDRFTER